MDNEETINQPVTEEVNIIKDNTEVIAEVPEIKVPQIIVEGNNEESGAQKIVEAVDNPTQIIGEGQPIQKTGEAGDNPINTNPDGSTGPKGINWIEAKSFYMESFSRSYKEVAKKFNVSEWTVEERGSKESWVEARKKLGEKAMIEFENNKIMEIAAANKNHLITFRSLSAYAARQLYNKKDIKPTEISAVANALKVAFEAERLILGLPTSNTKSEIMGKLSTDLSLSSEEIKHMDDFFKNEAV
jgi:hypothetical protein